MPKIRKSGALFLEVAICCCLIVDFCNGLKPNNSGGVSSNSDNAADSSGQNVELRININPSGGFEIVTRGPKPTPTTTTPTTTTTTTSTTPSTTTTTTSTTPSTTPVRYRQATMRTWLDRPGSSGSSSQQIQHKTLKTADGLKIVIGQAGSGLSIKLEGANVPRE